MVGKNDTERSPTSIERARKKQLAQEEGSRMMAQFQQEAVAVRKNMERLRALRLAKEADASSEPPSDAKGKKKSRKKA
ncbi:transcriptional regulator [Rhodopseudomonas sp. HC1]|uniref:transcriptional regulator n=1 Tax=Rhodopseudomonas infernalis TaxID=2897386 RepID=UPI001EE82C77|nr:transcriptional regulator [Rhodopseudomonas infernalis]MCG6206032.1 transcriptional regulator [Rhodopseudomonas infernalis]